MAIRTDRIHQLKSFLDDAVEKYNRIDFIADDPIAVPRGFSLKQDIEIAGLMAATLAWGQRKTILNKSREWLAMMDGRPYEFVLQHSDRDLIPIGKFVHRTFNGTDALYFIDFLKRFYKDYESLEELFVDGFRVQGAKTAIANFRSVFFDSPHAPLRTRKHVPDPHKGSACKRINMFLRWMVRADQSGVDFGLWKKIPSAKLICPVDLHVERVARALKLIRRKQVDWDLAEELTAVLRRLDPEDPVKYDFALFGMGLNRQ